MGDKISLKLDKRDVQGKKVARLRQEGLVPSVVYGPGMEPVLAQSEYVETMKVVSRAGKHTPVQLTVSGKKRIGMVKHVDRHPVKATLRHISFHAVKANEAVTAEIPLHIAEGQSEAERAGLVVLQAIEHVNVKAKPADLPDELIISTDGLATTEDRVTLGDLQLPAGVELAEEEPDFELALANVYEPSALAAANEATGGDAEDETEVEADNGDVAPQGEVSEGKVESEEK